MHTLNSSHVCKPLTYLFTCVQTLTFCVQTLNSKSFHMSFVVDSLLFLAFALSLSILLSCSLFPWCSLSPSLSPVLFLPLFPPFSLPFSAGASSQGFGAKWRSGRRRGSGYGNTDIYISLCTYRERERERERAREREREREGERSGYGEHLR